MKNKILYLLLVLILIPLQVNAVVPKSDKEYVTDEANLLSDESEDYIVKYSKFLYKTKQIDYYLVTVESLDDLEIEDYIDELIKEYKINKRSLVILFSKEDSKIRIQAGEKLSEIVPESLMTEYIDTYFMPYLERYDYEDGLMNGYNALYKHVCEEYNIDASSMETVDKLDFLTKYSNIIIVVLIWIGFILGGRYIKYYLIYKSKVYYYLAETIELVSMIIFNIFAIALAYLLKPTYVILVIASELIAFFSSLSRYKSLDKRPKRRLRKTSYKRKTKNYKRRNKK